MKKISVDENKAKNIFTTHGIPVYTPYQPYEGQKLYIEYVLDRNMQIVGCLNKGANALVQSPTGTGKTMSLLCSTLSWLKYRQQTVKDKNQLSRRIIYTSRTHAQLKQIIEQLVRTGFEVKLSVLASRDHTCLNKDLKQLNGQSKELECRLRTVKKNGLFCKYFHHQEYFEKMKTMGQIIDLEDLGSKGKTEGFCPFFYQKSSKNIANLILMPYNYLFDDYGSNYEDIINLVKNSILIFDEGHNIPNICQQSKEYSITLSTLTRALQQLAELREINLNERKGPSNKTKKIVESEEEDKQKLMKTTAEEIEMHASYVSLIHAHMQTLVLPNQENGILMDGRELLVCLQNGTKEGQFGGLQKNIGKLVNSAVCLKGDILYRPFWAIGSWISFLYKIRDIYEQNKEYPKVEPKKIEKPVKSFMFKSSLQSQPFPQDSPQFQGEGQKIQEQDCYKCQIAYQGSDIKLSFICLDPKTGFQKIKRLNPHSIILTSGTLSPLNSFPMELEVQFQKPLACPHIISNEQVNGCILTAGPQKTKLNFCYENRQNKTLYKELGQILEDVATYTDHGVIVFVSSYMMIEKIKIELGDNGYLSRIYAKKMIFCEKKNSADFKITLEQYLKECEKTKGALLFALARGKISEGLDFSDEKCRAVVLVGVPYPAAKDIKVMAKMSYLDEKSKIKKTMNGKQWYICETIRCINQIIGRIVRHKKDYGSIYLLDERYSKGEILNQISSWAKGCLKTISDYEQFKFKVELFRKYNDERDREAYEADNFFRSARGTMLGNKIDPSIKLVKGSISLSKAPDPAIKGKLEQKNPVAEERRNIDTAELMKNMRQKYKAEISEEKSKLEEAKPSREKVIFGTRNAKKLPIILQQCPVCRLEKRLIKNSECVHELCQDCWDIWLKKDLRCPICRVRVREKYLIKN